MRIGFDATTIRARKTGVGYYTARLLERLTRVDGEANPIDELVILSNETPSLPGAIPRSSLYPHGRFPVRALWMQAVLPSILARIRPDVSHFTNFLAPIATDTRYVVTFHDMSLQLMPGYHTLKKRWLTASLMPEIGRKARLIITPSESARRDVSRILSLPLEKIRAIPHAADPLFRPDASEAALARIERRYGIRKPYLLSVGTFEPRKNVARSLEAFAAVARRRPELSFYLVGELGWKYDRVLAALERLRLGERVRRLGYVEEADLPALYSHAALFIYPSLYEGFGFPVLEAMACGVPVLTSASSALEEIASGAALLVDPCDVPQIERAMESGLQPGAERNALVARGRERAASFSWERTVRETLAVYEEAAERCAVRGRAVRPRPLDGSSAARAVLKTVAYGALFGFPLRLDEIERGLMEAELDRDEIGALLAGEPELRSKVEKRGPYYCLRHRGRDIPARWARERATRDLLSRHARFLSFLCRAPFVRMAALSGATAYGNVSDDDIDLFLITAPGRTWAVLFWITAAAKLAGLRRVICANYLVSESALALGERDPFTAQQIVSLKPLVGRGAYLRFVAANEWGSRFFPNFWKSYRAAEWAAGERPFAGAPRLELLLAFGGGWLLERLGRALLGRRLRRRFLRAGRPAAVRLESERIKLHFKDHGMPLNRRLETILREPVDGDETILARR